MVSPYLTDAIKKVEAAHYAPFSAQPAIYVCATKPDFYRLTGRRAPATVTNKLFLSPELFQEQRPLERYLTHELSHLHLVQRLGLLGGARLPAWFKEGLAELVAGGATGSSVTVRDAYEAINSKHSFYPDEGSNPVSSFLFPRYGTYWHIENRMFYRQSMLFVQFMRDYDEDAFHKFLVAVERGTEFKKALREAYGGGLTILWCKFLDKARAATSQAPGRIRLRDPVAAALRRDPYGPRDGVLAYAPPLRLPVPKKGQDYFETHASSPGAVD